MCPSVLTAHTSGKPFLLIVRSTEHSLGALLAQHNDQGHEQAIYYLNRNMVREEHSVHSSREGITHSRIRGLEDATLFGGPNNLGHFKSQSLKIAHDKCKTRGFRMFLSDEHSHTNIMPTFIIVKK